jgi:uncharacterized membrane protein (UPF0136 family)
MKCYYHPEVEAVASCTTCGKAICQQCAVNVSGKYQCQQCLSTGMAPRGEIKEAKPTNPLSIISLILGIVGLMGCLCGGSIGGILFGLPAGITGWIARKQHLESPEEQQGLPLATTGLVLGIAEVVISILVLLLFGSVYGLAFLSELLQ